MAVVYKGVHHRNPSGRNNKIKWLLSEAKWDACKLCDVLKDVEHGDSTDWFHVKALAYLKIQLEAEKDSELILALDRLIETHRMPHYILMCVCDLQDYIKKELHNGKEADIRTEG